MRRFLVACFVWLALAFPAQAISIANIGTSTGGSATSGTLSSVTESSGGVIYVILRTSVAVTSPSCSDGTNGAYTLITTKTNTQEQLVFYFNNSASLSTATITCSWTTSAAWNISASYITGQSASPLDTAVTNSASGTSTAPSVSNAGTPGVSGELFIGSVVASATFTQASGWAAPPNGTTSIEAGNLVNAGTGNQTYNPTLGSSVAWTDIIVAFKPSGGAPTVIYNFTTLGAGS